MGVTLKKQTGFTIIELLIVIVVIAILARLVWWHIAEYRTELTLQPYRVI